MKERLCLFIIFLCICRISVASKIDIQQSIRHDTVLAINNRSQPISAFSINMKVDKTLPSSFVRIILEDMNGKQYLVAESYKEIADKKVDSYVSYSDETECLPGIYPKELKVFVRNTSVDIRSWELVSGENEFSDINKGNRNDSLRLKAIQRKVDMINNYNNTHQKLWTAGVTPLSLMPFEDKMRSIGFDVSENTGGFEYYVGGIFEIGEIDENSQRLNRDMSSPYVDNFDWTYRHGKNWMTGVRNQGSSYYCVPYAFLACTEALANLYYNRKIDLDLSEQEVACCSGAINPYNDGIWLSTAATYMASHSVFDEASYPFVDSQNATYCRKDYITPAYSLQIGGYESCNYGVDDSIKKRIINYGPIISGFSTTTPVRGHAMALVGYGTIHEGDSIREIKKISNEQTTCTDHYCIPANSPYIGMTYWKFKNSHGLNSNDDVDGYMYLLFLDNCWMVMPAYRINYPFTITNEITHSPMYTDSDIVCSDADGDGYYFWGLGHESKPVNCPAWVPDEPDGDDSDPSAGPMDEYGNLTDISANEIIVSSLVEYSTIINRSHNIRIKNGGVLNISNTTTLQNNSQIIVESGRELTVDGGTLNEARITLYAGSTLNIQNDGTISMATGEDFSAPIGASVNLLNGKIN